MTHSLKRLKIELIEKIKNVKDYRKDYIEAASSGSN